MVFGDVAFSGSWVIFWCTAPFLLFAAIAVPCSLENWNAEKAVAAAAFSLGCLLAILAIYDARRFRWAARSVTGLIFLTFLAYLFAECFFTGRGFWPTARSQSSPWNATFGMLLIGLPALWYTVLGRFTLARPEPEEDAVAWGPEEEEEDEGEVSR